MHYLKSGVFVTDKIIVPVSLRVLNKIAKHYSVTVIGILLFNVCSLFASIILKDFNWLAASGGVHNYIWCITDSQPFSAKNR